jgi:transcriptional regulator with XRE-family HTH domain
MLLSELGNRIRSHRERLGLKQQDIANALQISPQAVSKWERGENGPDIAILGDLARLLGVSTDWLLDAQNQGLDVFDATVFASSVIGAYEKSLKMEARDFASWANGLFSQLTEVILRNDGVPVKYLGDKLLAFFSGVDHHLRASRSALLAA